MSDPGMIVTTGETLTRLMAFTHAVAVAYPHEKLVYSCVPDTSGMAAKIIVHITFSPGTLDAALAVLARLAPLCARHHCESMLGKHGSWIVVLCWKNQAP